MLILGLLCSRHDKPQYSSFSIVRLSVRLLRTFFTAGLTGVIKVIECGKPPENSAKIIRICWLTAYARAAS